MQVAFIATNFNNSRYTASYVQSLCKVTGFDGPIIVIDNDSKPEEQTILRELDAEHTNLHVIFNDVNVGYFKGLNAGLAYMKDNFPECAFAVVGNNDLEFDQHFVERLFALPADLIAKYPVLAPQMIDIDGNQQNPSVVAEISSFRNRVYDLYYTHFVMAKLISRAAVSLARLTSRSDREHFEVRAEIKQGHGACYILTPTFFEHFDQLWSPTFLMHEEWFLSRQLEEKGFRMLYEPSLVLTHDEHSSVGTLPSKKLWSFAQESHKFMRAYVAGYDSQVEN